MNEPIILASFNADSSKINKYKNNKNLEASRNNIFSIITQHNAATVDKRLFRGHMPSEHFFQSRQEGAYGEEEVVEKLDKLKKITRTNDGVARYVYMFDTETTGQPKAFNTGINPEMDKLNNDIFGITELSMFRQKYINGKPVGDKEQVINFTSGHNQSKYTTYINTVSKTSKYNSSNTESTLVRIGGYHNPKNFENGDVLAWDNVANTRDLSVLANGGYNLANKTKYRVGTEEYNVAVSNIYKKLLEITNDENSIISGMNSNAFDNEVLFEFMRNAGVDVTDDFINSYNNSHIDIQQAMISTVRGEVFKNLQDARESGVEGIEDNMKVSNLAHASNQRGANIDTSTNYHVAREDVKVSLDVTDNFLDDLFKASDSIKDDISKKVATSDKAIYYANYALSADPEVDTFFSDSGFKTPNTYNPVIMEAGHSYKINALSVKDISNLPEELKEQAKELQNKKILRFTDLYEDSPRTSYLIVDSASEIQNRLLDTGRITVNESSKAAKENIKNSTEAAIIDKTRVNRSNFYKVNSDKGYDSFKTLFDMFQDYTNNVDGASKETLIADIKKGFIEDFDGEETRIQDALSGIFRKSNEDAPIIHERAKELVNMFDDFQNNRTLYSSFETAVYSAVGDIEEFKSKYGIRDNRTAKRLYNRAKTSALASVKKSFDDEVLNLISDDEVLDYVMEKTPHLKQLYDTRVKEIENASGRPLDFEVKESTDHTRFKKDLFEFYFKEEFDKTKGVANRAIFGLEEVKNTMKDLNSIDILGVDEGYTRLNVSSKRNFINSLNDSVNTKISAPNKSPKASSAMRRNYLRKVAEDMNKRGIITQDGYESVMKSNSVQSMLESITNATFDRKKHIDNLILKASGSANKQGRVEDAIFSNKINYSKLTNEEGTELITYLKNVRENPIYAQKDGYKILGMSADEFIENKMPYMFKDGVPTSKFDEVFTNVAKNAVPEFMTFSNVSTLSDASREEISKKLIEELGWTESNSSNFINKVLGAKFDDFTYSTSGKKVNGLSHTIIKRDGESFLVTSPKDRERLVMDKIIQGVEIDDLKQHAGVWHMPKVETIGGENGLKVIKQSDVAYKAVTNDIVLKYTDEIPSYAIEDTVDTVINSLGRNLRYAKQSMEDRNFVRASSRMGSSWSDIHTNKSLSSVVARAIDTHSGITIKKQVGLNRADYSLSSMVDISDLMYSLDIVTQRNIGLKDSLAEAGGSSIIAEIKRFKTNGRKNNIEKKTFDQWEMGVKMWTSKNISEIANTLLEDKEFISENDTLMPILKKMSEIGVRGFYGKDSGDANRGFYFLNPPDSLVAGSKYSGGSRPLMNQVMSALPIYEEDMKVMSMYNNLNMYHKDMFEHLGLKKYHSYATDTLEDFIEAQSNFDKGMYGFSMKTKIMSSNDFLNSLNDLYLNKESREKAIQDILKNNPEGIFAISDDEIKQIARGMSSVTNLHEDSGFISPLVASVLQPKTITSQEFFLEENKFKINDILETGTYLGKDASGKDVRYNKERAKIVSIADGKFTLQMNKEYRDVKFGFGGSEKVELHTLRYKDSREAKIIDEVTKYITGGASAIVNPNLTKHEAGNTILSAYTNAITNNITSKEELDKVNASFKKHFGANQDIEVRWNKPSNRYIVFEGDVKNPFNILEAFNNVIEDAKDINTNMNIDIKRISEESIGVFDVVTMQDNTILAGQGSDNIGKGASINYRSQTVMGTFIGEGDIEDIKKYRTVVDGKIANIWQPLIDSDIEQLASDKKFIRMQEQVHNIRATLAASIGEEIDGSNIVKYNLDDAIIGGSILKAEDIPGIFKYAEGERIHGYEIDLSQYGLKIKNFIYDDLKNREKKGKQDPTNIIINKKIEKYTDKIFIPALDTNATPDGYTLSNTQKAASDLINDINDFVTGRYKNISREKLIERIDEGNEKLIKSMRFELTDKKGFAKRSMKIKSKFSGRQKLAKVAAPITEDGFKYKDLDFRDASTKIVNGKKKHYGAIYLSYEDFTSKGISFKTIGEQLTSGTIDDSEEALNVLKGIFNDDKISKAKNMKEASIILNGYDISNKQYTNLGIKYLEDVGVVGRVMRDPAMYSTSYQAVNMRASKHLTKGTITMDAVTALLMNADGDGDEINIFMDALTEDKKGEIKLKSKNNEDVKTLRQIIELNSDSNNEKFKEAVGQYKEKILSKNSSKLSIKQYMKDVEDLRGFDFIKNMNYIESEDTVFGNLFARFSKASIGQISNPNHFLKSAATSYFADKPYSLASHKSMSNIQYLTHKAEQTLIDTKSIKLFSDAQKVSEVVSSYRESMDNLSSKNASKSKNALLQMYHNLVKASGASELKDEDLDTARVILGFDAKLYNENPVEAAEEAVNRILNNKTNKILSGRQATVEEVLGDYYEVLQDDNARNVFNSAFVRQSDINNLSGEGLSELDKIYRDLGLENFEVSSGNKLEELVNGRTYLTNSIIHDNKILEAGSSLYTTSNNEIVGEGSYLVETIKRNGTVHTLELKDSSTEDVVLINGKNFEEISEKIKGLKRVEGDISPFKELVNKYKEGISTDVNELIRVQGILEEGRTKSLKYKAANIALKDYNVQNLQDSLGTVEVLKNKGYINESDGMEYLRSMNEALKSKASGNYREIKKKKLLGLSSITANGISSDTAIKSLLDNEVSKDSIDEIFSSARYSNDVSKIKSFNRINIEDIGTELSDMLDSLVSNDKQFENYDLLNISEHKNAVIKNTIEKYSKKDLEIVEGFKNVFTKHASNLDFQRDVLGLNLEKIDELLKYNETSKAVDLMNSVKISYGEYIGKNISELDNTHLKKIINGNYDTSGINSDVVEKTNGIVNKILSLNESGIDREINIPKPPSVSTDDVATQLREAINNKITEKGKKASKMRENTGKFKLDKLSDLMTSAKGNKKFLLGAAATAATVIAGSYMYGNNKMKEQDKQYVSKNNNSYSDSNVKTNENEPTRTSNHSQVPDSDKRFYNSNNNVSMNINGQAPSGASANQAGDIVSSMFNTNGSGATINTNISDSRRSIQERDVEALMSQSTGYY